MLEVKVCGIDNQKNLKAISKLPIDYIGINFYPQSPRYLNEDLDFSVVPDQIKKVGVFVDEETSLVLNIVDRYKLDYVQLHGTESPEYCLNLQSKVKIIKVFTIESEKDLNSLSEYSICDLFLFDTKGTTVGGTGKKFKWSILKNLPDDHAFLLAGGIGPKDVERILKLDIPGLKGVDINSKFEITPGTKDVSLVKEFTKQLKSKA